jgi:hypothetical protein
MKLTYRIPFLLLVVLLFLPSSRNTSGQVVTKTPLFEFHSGFWVNLHHYVRGVARMRLYSTQSAQQTQTVSNIEWDSAVNYYKKEMADRDLLFDLGMQIIKNTLEDAELANDLSGVELPNDLKKTWKAQRLFIERITGKNIMHLIKNGPRPSLPLY